MRIAFTPMSGDAGPAPLGGGRAARACEEFAD